MAKKAKKRVRRTNPRAIDTVPLPEKPARRKKKSKKTKRKARKKK